MDGEAEPRPNVDGFAEGELRRKPDGRIVGLPGGIERTEDVRLELCSEGLGDRPAAKTQREVGSAFQAAEVRRKLHIMNKDSAEQFAGIGGCRHSGGSERETR